MGNKLFSLFGITGILLAATVILTPQTASAVDNSFYIDCSAGVNGDGSIGSPWNTPQSLDDHQRNPGRYTFGARDEVLIRSGTTCNYPIVLFRGSGTPGNPVTVTSYGTGDRPIINGSLVSVDNWDGIIDSAAVFLRDFDNVTVEGLELTNTGGGENEGRRMGIWSLATEVYGERANITLRDNYIHDIQGEYKKNTEATAGINIEQRLPPNVVDPNPLPTWYDSILIEDNVIENTNRQGITFWGDWRNRPEDGYNPTGPAWTAWTNVVIQDNDIRSVRGDAIIISNTDGAIIQRNTVDGFNEINALSEAEVLAIRTDAQTKQGLTNLPSRKHAGIWTYNADNTLIQYNDVRGGVSNEDGMAFDIDGGSINTIIQYNYSEENDGGFALICGEIGQIRDGIIRYNISKNDGYASITSCVGEVLNTQVYNNTIYSTDPTMTYPYIQVDWVRYPGDLMDEDREISIENNIFSYPQESLPNFFYTNTDGLLTPGSVHPLTTADSNIYHGMAAPSKDAAAITSDPYFEDVGLEAPGFTLYGASQGFAAGKTISGNGGVDYLGEALTTPPNIGALQGSVTDTDGVSDAIEQAGPNSGDGNGDSTPDAVQRHVTSFISDETSDYLTLQAQDVGQLNGTPSECASISSISGVTEDSLGTDADFSYPFGFIDFTLTCANNGESSEITIFLDDEYDTTDWEVRKHADSIFSTVADATFGTATRGGDTITTLTYTAVDGGANDEDLIANGTIVDPIGIALPLTEDGSEATPVASPTPTENQTSSPDSDELAETGSALYIPSLTGAILIAGTMILKQVSMKSKYAIPGLRQSRQQFSREQRSRR